MRNGSYQQSQLLETFYRFVSKFYRNQKIQTENANGTDEKKKQNYLKQIESHKIYYLPFSFLINRSLSRRQNPSTENEVIG